MCLGLYWVYIWMMENEMEAIIMGLYRVKVFLVQVSRFWVQSLGFRALGSRISVGTSGFHLPSAYIECMPLECRITWKHVEHYMETDSKLFRG